MVSNDTKICNIQTVLKIFLINSVFINSNLIKIRQIENFKKLVFKNPYLLIIWIFPHNYITKQHITICNTVNLSCKSYVYFYANFIEIHVKKSYLKVKFFIIRVIWFYPLPVELYSQLASHLYTFLQSIYHLFCKDFSEKLSM